jgi:hypothetical protein
MLFLNVFAEASSGGGGGSNNLPTQQEVAMRNARNGVLPSQA